MTSEAQLAALAEACPNVIRCVHGRWQYFDGLHWFNCKDNDPLNDLNAIHEAEKRLDSIDQLYYADKLCALVVERDGHVLQAKELYWLLCSATASQRREAILRTLGKWTDDD